MRIMFGALILIIALMVGLQCNLKYIFPLDENLAQSAVSEGLHSFVDRDGVEMSLSPSGVVNRNDELIFYGRGSTYGRNLHASGMPLVEHLQFDYLAVVTRVCHRDDAACYTPDEIEISGKKSYWPLI